MNFEKIKLEELQPSEYNPRQISGEQSDKLKNSLQEFGLVDPIIVNLKTKHVIGGHQRYNILKQNKNKEYSLIKLGDIGWIFDDENITIKDENHEKALNVALNKISGEWDKQKLQELFQELNTESFNLEITGFNNIELNSFNITPNENNIPQITIPVQDETTTTEDTQETEQPTEHAPPTENSSNDYPEVSPVSYKEFYVLEIELSSEEELEKVYNEMKEKGYKCRVLTL